MVDPDDLKIIQNRNPEIEIQDYFGWDDVNDNDRAEQTKKYMYFYKKYKIDFSVPTPAAELDAAYLKGMLRKDELVDGEYYWGICRNARVARWSSRDGKFTHMRFKGNWYPEKIPYPGDEEVIG